MWCLWFSALVFLHLMVQLCKDRFEYVSIINNTSLLLLFQVPWAMVYHYLKWQYREVNKNINSIDYRHYESVSHDVCIYPHLLSYCS